MNDVHNRAVELLRVYRALQYWQKRTQEIAVAEISHGFMSPDYESRIKESDDKVEHFQELVMSLRSNRAIVRAISKGAERAIYTRYGTTSQTGIEVVDHPYHEMLRALPIAKEFTAWDGVATPDVAKYETVRILFEEWAIEEWANSGARNATYFYIGYSKETNTLYINTRQHLGR